MHGIQYKVLYWDAALFFPGHFESCSVGMCVLHRMKINISTFIGQCACSLPLLHTWFIHDYQGISQRAEHHNQLPITATVIRKT